MVWDAKHKMYVEESPSEYEARVKRVRNAMRTAEFKLQRLESERIRRGYCPKCHLGLPESGKCSCGYVKDVSTNTQNVYRGYVNPAILAMYSK